MSQSIIKARGYLNSITGHHHPLINKVTEFLPDILKHISTRTVSNTLAYLIPALLHPTLSPVVEAIHQNPAQSWTVNAMAELCFMSRAGFSSLFKSVLQQTPMEYVTQWRMALAYRMLADEKATTLQTALAVGYDNES
jgi:AraC-like DNA-binding protein